METLEQTLFNLGINHDCPDIFAVPLAKGLDFTLVKTHCSDGDHLHEHKNDGHGGTIEPCWSMTSQPRLLMGKPFDIISSNDRSLQQTTHEAINVVSASVLVLGTASNHVCLADDNC